MWKNEQQVKQEIRDRFYQKGLSSHDLETAVECVKTAVQEGGQIAQRALKALIISGIRFKVVSLSEIADFSDSVGVSVEAAYRWTTHEILFVLEYGVEHVGSYLRHEMHHAVVVLYNRMFTLFTSIRGTERPTLICGNPSDKRADCFRLYQDLVIPFLNRLIQWTGYMSDQEEGKSLTDQGRFVIENCERISQDYKEQVIIKTIKPVIKEELLKHKLITGTSDSPKLRHPTVIMGESTITSVFYHGSDVRLFGLQRCLPSNNTDVRMIFDRFMDEKLFQLPQRLPLFTSPQVTIRLSNITCNGDTCVGSGRFFHPYWRCASFLLDMNQYVTYLLQSSNRIQYQTTEIIAELNGLLPVQHQYIAPESYEYSRYITDCVYNFYTNLYKMYQTASYSFVFSAVSSMIEHASKGFGLGNRTNYIINGILLGYFVSTCIYGVNRTLISSGLSLSSSLVLGGLLGRSQHFTHLVSTTLSLGLLHGFNRDIFFTVPTALISSFAGRKVGESIYRGVEGISRWIGNRIGFWRQAPNQVLDVSSSQVVPHSQVEGGNVRRRPGH